MRKKRLIQKVLRLEAEVEFLLKKWDVLEETNKRQEFIEQQLGLKETVEETGIDSLWGKKILMKEFKLTKWEALCAFLNIEWKEEKQENIPGAFVKKK